MEERHRIAVFIDFDNIEIGVKNTLNKNFDVSIVLEALKERGEVLTKIAYADWTHHGEMSRSFSQHGVQMVQRHPGPRGDKNGADINLALDALEMALTQPHIDAFAIVSGDSDFISLVEKLKQYNKVVFVVGGRAFTSTILQKNCREFINYENLLPSVPSGHHRSGRGQQRASRSSRSALPLKGVMPLLDRALEVLARREVQPQLGLLKSTMLQLDSSFTERDYGTSSFRQFVEMLDKAGLVKLQKKRGHYLIEMPTREEEEESTAEESVLKHEDALSVLHSALRVIDENDLWGKLDFNAVRGYVEHLEPGFDEKRYGFAQFAELLNYAQDLSMVRLEADADEVLRVYPGRQFTPSRPTVAPVVPEPEKEPAAVTEAQPETEAAGTTAEKEPAAEAEAAETVAVKEPAAEAEAAEPTAEKKRYPRRKRHVRTRKAAAAAAVEKEPAAVAEKAEPTAEKEPAAEAEAAAAAEKEPAAVAEAAAAAAEKEPASEAEAAETPAKKAAPKKKRTYRRRSRTRSTATRKRPKSKTQPESAEPEQPAV